MLYEKHLCGISYNHVKLKSKYNEIGLPGHETHSYSVAHRFWVKAVTKLISIQMRFRE